MEREANYVAVGTFILVVLAMAVGFLLWYSNARDAREYQRYEIYFTGSVTGLDRGSPVRFLGVDVGRVLGLEINERDATEVSVLVEVDEAAPVSVATRASLGLQGVTGLLYINLRDLADVERAGPLPQGERYPVIQAVESNFDAFLSSLPELMGRANTLLDRFARVVSDDNLRGLSTSIASMSEAMASLPQASKDAAALINELRGTVAEIDSAARSLRAMTDETRPEVQAAIGQLSQVAEHIASAAQRLDSFTQRSEVQLGHFTEQGLFELERLVRETRSAAIEFRDLSRSLKDNPSQILYEPPVSGVEIKP